LKGSSLFRHCNLTFANATWTSFQKQNGVDLHSKPKQHSFVKVMEIFGTNQVCTNSPRQTEKAHPLMRACVMANGHDLITGEFI
jgi:hypothetical protein